jgi:hypothetical protein
MMKVRIAAVTSFALVLLLPAMNMVASVYEAVVIDECTFKVSSLDKPVEIEGTKYNERLTVVLRGKNFMIRALDPIVKLGDRQADDFRIFPDETGMEAYFYGPADMEEAESVSVGYPGAAPTVFGVKVPTHILQRMNQTATP